MTDERTPTVSTNPSPGQLPLGGGRTWAEATDSLLDVVRAHPNDSSRRFTPAWAKRQQARLLAVDRHAREWTGTTVLLSPTARTTYPGNEGPIPPRTHYEHLRSSASARKTALSRALRDVQRWRAVRVIGATASGHIAPHVALFCSEPVDSARFEPWVQSHIGNCALATTEAHGPGAVRIEEDTSSTSETGAIGYLMMNVPSLDTRGDRVHGLADEPRHRSRTASLIEAVDATPVRLGRTTSH